MKELSCDLHIVGGALTGLLTAYCASSLEYNIIVTEREKITLDNKKPTKDTRTTAIAEGSKVFLETQGLWKFVQGFAEPIKNIKVIDTTANSNLDFYNPISKYNIGYIVKNSNLINVLIRELRKKDNVTFINNSSINSISYENPLVEVSKYW